MQLDTVVARLDVHEYVPARLLPVPVVPFLDELAFERLEERLGDRIVERGLGLDADWAIPWDSRRPWSSWKTRLRRRAGAPARRLLDGVCCHLLDNPLRYRQSHHLARECVDYDRQVEQSIVGGHVDDMVPLIVLHKFSQPPVQLLFEQRLVQVSAGAPFAVRDVLQAGGHQHQCGFPVGERADHAGPAPDLPVEPLDGVVRADAPPMPAGHPQYVSVSAKPSRTTLAASFSFIDSSSSATDSAFAAEVSRDSMAWIVLGMAATWERLDLGILASALR